MDVEMVCACAYCLGVHGEEETPVPIPNTEVKLLSGDYTALRETSTMPNYMNKPPEREAFHFIDEDIIYYCNITGVSDRLSKKVMLILLAFW